MTNAIRNKVVVLFLFLVSFPPVCSTHGTNCCYLKSWWFFRRQWQMNVPWLNRFRWKDLRISTDIIPKQHKERMRYWGDTDLWAYDKWTLSKRGFRTIAFVDQLHRCKVIPLYCSTHSLDHCFSYAFKQSLLQLELWRYLRLEERWHLAP